MFVLLLFMHLLVVDSILYNVPKSKIDRLQRFQNQCAHILTKSPCREHITPVLKKLHWLKSQDRIIYKMWMLTYKSYYNMALAWELIIISLLYHQLVRIVLTLSLSIHSFMLLLAVVKPSLNGLFYTKPSREGPLTSICTSWLQLSWCSVVLGLHLILFTFLRNFYAY